MDNEEPRASVAAVPEVVGVVANSTETTQQPSSSSTSETSVRTELREELEAALLIYQLYSLIIF